MNATTRIKRLQLQDNLLDNVADIERRVRAIERATPPPTEVAIMGDDGLEYWLRVVVIRGEPRLVIVRKAE